MDNPSVSAAQSAASRGDLWACVDRIREVAASGEVDLQGLKAALDIARRIGDEGGAVLIARRYFEKSGASAEARMALAEALTDVGLAREAVNTLSPISGALPADQLFKFTRILMFAGRLDDAHLHARRLLATNPHSPTLWERLAQTKRFKVGDADFADMHEVLRHWPISKPKGRAAIAAALAKAYVDVGDDALANQFLTMRAEANRVHTTYSPAILESAARDVENWCASSVEDVAERGGEGGARPVFILGPNRSGTTLIDQILSRHPEIGGGGERRQFWVASSVLGDCSTSATAAYLARARAQGVSAPWTSIAKRYLNLVSELVEPGQRFTDKLLSNVYRVRAILQALPSAKIIYVERNPLAVAWSCWRAQFDAESPWSNSPEGIALYLATYRRMMAAWMKRYPGAIFTVSYEELVRAPDLAIPGLLSACGLPDHEATRQPHLSERGVTTLSFAEIRRPIHSESVEAAASFPASVRALREALDDAGLQD